MEAIKLREVRGFDMKEMFSVPPERERETLFTFVGMSENIPAMSESFTLVLNRDVRASVEMSSELAVFLAKKYPERNVMLVNTYAGSDIMQRTLALGRVVATPVVGEMESGGAHETSFDTKDLPPGIYSCRLSADGAEMFAKMVVVR